MTSQNNNADLTADLTDALEALNAAIGAWNGRTWETEATEAVREAWQRCRDIDDCGNPEWEAEAEAEAERLQERADDEAERIADLAAEANDLGREARDFLIAGDWDEAETRLRRAAAKEAEATEGGDDPGPEDSPTWSPTLEALAALSFADPVTLPWRDYVIITDDAREAFEAFETDARNAGDAVGASLAAKAAAGHPLAGEIVRGLIEDARNMA